MKDDMDLNGVSLSWLTNESRNLLSNLLNTTKIIPTDSPEKLPRYWLGIASLANISKEIASSIDLYPDKTAKLLEIWMKNNPSSAYVGRLLEFLRILDRYDVYDDCIDLHRQGRLIAIPNSYPVSPSLEVPEDDRLITYEDKMIGAPQFYHAYVVYAQADKDFVDDLLSRMRALGFRLCTENDLLPGHATLYGPVSRLMSERCQRIILVYSPEFLESPANNYYTNYAQAVAIDRKQIKIIPLMYRPCQLPSQMAYYHKLLYTPIGQKAPYDFWQKLRESLEITGLPRLNSTESNHSAVNISEITNSSLGSSDIANGYAAMKHPYLPLPSIPPIKSVSMTGLDSCKIVKIPLDDSKSLRNVSQSSERRQKKPSIIKSMINSLKKKNKKAVPMLEG